MKRSTKVKIIVFFIVFFLCFVDLRPLFRPKKPEPTIITTPITDQTRKNHNKGSCYDMESNLCYFVIHLDDKESSWNEKEKTEFIEKKFLVSLDYLSQKANEYSVSISKNYKDISTQVVYDGIIETEVVKNGSQEDILNQVASSLGYKSPEEMDDSLKKETSIEQIAYLIIVNKEGRSYKYSYTPETSKQIEFCVFFDDSLNFDNTTCCSTIAHEILHLFGAEDFYNPYGEMPQREKLAKELYPNDIMLTLVNDVNNAKIGAYTAYAVGWTDTLPKECNAPEWWE
jgi:hypothetical protein